MPTFTSLLLCSDLFQLRFFTLKYLFFGRWHSDSEQSRKVGSSNKKNWRWQDVNPGLLGLEARALTTKPWPRLQYQKWDELFQRKDDCQCAVNFSKSKSVLISFFCLKLHSLAPQQGTSLRTHYWEDRKKQNIPASCRIGTHDLEIMKRVHCRCATFNHCPASCKRNLNTNRL